MRQRTSQGAPLRERIEFHSMPVTECGCWIWLTLPTKRYGELKIDGRMIKAHRASWIAYRGPIPEGLCVLHRCDVTACVNPDHLFLGTQGDNVRDMFAKGRALRPGLQGESNGAAKLTAENVREIRASTLHQNDLAKIYGVTPLNIYAIRRRKSWRSVA